ncbi:hypothetical protein BD560DRAFT_340309 [Blakeslea trispora]|nr:hypothetical protein BD560DRAFT_340309 [Blakeslea trispora]
MVNCFETWISLDLPKLHLTFLVYAILYPKIIGLSSSAPRWMMNLVLTIAKQEGKPILNGLIVPLVFQTDLAKPQTEVILKLAESLSDSQRYLFLQILLNDGEDYFTSALSVLSNQHRHTLKPWNDSLFQILQTILKPPLKQLTKRDLEDLLRSIDMLVQADPKDKQSMQLLLLLTSKYSQWLVEFDMIVTVERIAQTSTMFLKRAVLSQMSALQKKSLAL